MKITQTLSYHPFQFFQLACCGTENCIARGHFLQFNKAWTNSQKLFIITLVACGEAICALRKKHYKTKRDGECAPRRNEERIQAWPSWFKLERPRRRLCILQFKVCEAFWIEQVDAQAKADTRSHTLNQPSILPRVSNYRTSRVCARSLVYFVLWTKTWWYLAMGATTIAVSETHMLTSSGAASLGPFRRLPAIHVHSVVMRARQRPTKQCTLAEIKYRLRTVWGFITK